MTAWTLILRPIVVVSTVTAICASRMTGAEVLVSVGDDLETAVAKAEPGDTVLVRNGLYRDTRFRLHSSGTAAAPVTLKAQMPGEVRFTGRIRIEISGQHLVASGFLFEDALSSTHASIVEFRNAQSCRLTDCAFIRCGDPKSTFTRTINLAYGSQHNRIDHCYMTGTLSMGMGVVVRNSDSGRGNTDNRFDHNHFKNIKRLSSNGQEPIQLGQNQTEFGSVPIRAVVENNLFENASGDSEIISNKSADNIIRNNTMRDSKAGIVLRGGRNTLIEGNYCLRTRAIRIYGSGHTIVNNYLEETESGISLPAGQYRDDEFVSRAVSGSYQAASNILVAHNTIIDPKGPAIDVGSQRGQKHSGVEKNELPRGITMANNLVTGRTGVLISGVGIRDVIWQNDLTWPREDARAGDLASFLFQEDPLLVYNGTRYVPSPRSPVRDAGSVVPKVKVDFNGRERSDLPDIGCDEVSRDATTRKPLQPSDVGPSWYMRARQ